MREAGERIRRNALEFYELAMSSFASGENSMAVVCNFALSVELLLKSLDAKLLGSGSPSTGFQDAWTESNLWGHDLLKLFNDMDSTKGQSLATEYETQTGRNLPAELDQCKDYFIKARYAHEPSSGQVYEISMIKNISEGIQSVISAWGGTNA